MFRVLNFKRNNLICSVVFLLFFLCMAEGLQRCFKCKSMGQFGICGDPFTPNVTLVELNQTVGVEVVSCNSSWCGKITSPDPNYIKEYGITQRTCLDKGPKNGEEICSHITWRNKKFQMCVCQGDLCNSSKNMKINQILVLAAALISLKLIFLLN